MTNQAAYAETHCPGCETKLTPRERWEIHPTMAEPAKKSEIGKYCGPCAQRSNRFVKSFRGPAIRGL